VPKPHLASLLRVLEVFRIGLTQPSFENMLVVACGWILSQGAHTVTEALVVTDVAARRHHEAYHRFFSRGTWEPDGLGHWIFERLVPFLGKGALVVVIDDTLAPKKGPHIFGIGSHVDAVRSSRKRKVFSFGHCWVVLSVLVRVPFSARTWALPVLFRLYRNVKACPEADYAKKTELARWMLDVFIGWVGSRRIELAVDSGFSNSTVVDGLPEQVVLFGAMRPDAVLTEPPEAKDTGASGRPRKRGKAVPKPEAIAQDPAKPWQTVTAMLYGKKTQVRYKELCAQWYQACGTRLLRIVVVATTEGRIPYRVFFCTDATVDVVRILETYAGRWGIEVLFRELKQLLGFADSSARKEAAVRRVAPLVGLLYTALVVWFLEGAHESHLATPPVRPWYRHKRGLSFADILRAARRALAGWDILDPASHSRHLPTTNRAANDPAATAAESTQSIAA
jgi:DDE superfamily endonuclease